jgi:hypothetical protein
VASRQNVEIPTARLGQVAQEEGDLDRHPRPRMTLDVFVYPATVLVPPPSPGRDARERRVHVEMAVIQEDVPSQQVHHRWERSGVGEQVEERVVEGDEPLEMQRGAIG